MPVEYTFPTEEEKASWKGKQEASDKEARKLAKQSRLQELELKNLRKLFDGEDLTEVNAQRLQLRNEIQNG